MALLTLASPFTLNVNVSPIALPDPAESFDGLSCVVSGWGYTSAGIGPRRTATSTSTPRPPHSCDLRAANVLPDQLQYAPVSVVPLCSCAAALNAAVGDGFALSTCELCTSTTGGIDSCSGDSGGPVACVGRALNGTNSTVLAGVRSVPVRSADSAAPLGELLKGFVVRSLCRHRVVGHKLCGRKSRREYASRRLQQLHRLPYGTLCALMFWSLSY